MIPSLDDVLSEIHSLDVREAARRFQPKYTLVIVSRRGVDELIKYKRVPEFSEILAEVSKVKGRRGFIASAEMYPTREELESRIEKSLAEIKEG